MILLDTDHFSVFTDERDSRHNVLLARLDTAAEPVRCTVVTVEEMFRGWMAIIHRLRDIKKQVSAYDRLSRLLEVLNHWDIERFDVRAATQFANLRRQGIRIGTMDLKIAAIALATDALLLTSNQRDFSLMPGLRFADWLIQ